MLANDKRSSLFVWGVGEEVKKVLNGGHQLAKYWKDDQRVSVVKLVIQGPIS